MTSLPLPALPCAVSAPARVVSSACPFFLFVSLSEFSLGVTKDALHAALRMRTHEKSGNTPLLNLYMMRGSLLSGISSRWPVFRKGLRSLYFYQHALLAHTLGACPDKLAPAGPLLQLLQGCNGDEAGGIEGIHSVDAAFHKVSFCGVKGESHV